MSELSLTCPSPVTEAGVTSINVTASGAVTVTGAGESEVTTVGSVITISGTPHVTLQGAYDNGTGIITTSDGKPVKVEGTVSGTEMLAGSLTTSGQVTINLASDENFLIDGATNQRLITVGAFRQLHTPAIVGTRALNYVIDMNSQADTSAIVADYVTTGMVAGEHGTVFKVTVDTANSTGGTIESFYVTTVGSGTTTVHAVHAGPGVIPIEHESGVFGNVDTAFTFDDSGSSFADVTSDFNSSSSNATLFVEDDDLVYIGDDVQFSDISVILTTPASNPGIKPEFEFWNGSSWAGFGPVDGTNGFRVNGIITWTVADLSGWATTSVNGSTKYWVRIRRTSPAAITLPVEELIQTVTSILYTWDADGNLDIASVTAPIGTFSDSLTVSGVPVVTGVPGSLIPVVTITTDTVITQANVIVLANASSGNILVTLPATSGDAGRNYSIKKIDSTANLVTISGINSETIDGGLTATLTLQYENIPVVADGSNWHIL